MRKPLRFDTHLLLITAFVAALSACARAPLKDASGVMREARPPELSDDLGLPSLIEAISAEVNFLEKSWPPGSPSPDLHFGPRTISRADYLVGLKRVIALAQAAHRPEDFFSALHTEFSFYEVYGDQNWGDVFITSYYELKVSGAAKKQGRFTQAVYAAPPELVSLDLGDFDPKFAQERKLRGRVAPGNSFVPYYSREEVDSHAALKGRDLELCWLDPIDAFFLQIQGSGQVTLADGETLRLAYSDRNGLKYESIGKFLRTAIAPAEVNLQTIEAYLRKQNPVELHRILNLNPSYVFFKLSEISATTTLGVSAVDGRTVATDAKYFPKGALAFVVTTKPQFKDATELVPSAWQPLGRFVLDQDTGGAITGPGRMDLFWGRGEEAKRNAGAMKQRGRLYYLLPRAANRQ